MGLINVFAMMGMVINDLISIYSVIGSLMLFLGAFSKTPRNRFRQFADWSILGLVFGGISQICMAITGTTPEKIGFLRMSPILVDGLLLLSLFLLIGGWWVRKNRRR
jgi:hypothetical protein